jgi:hypothetical protein
MPERADGSTAPALAVIRANFGPDHLARLDAYGTRPLAALAGAEGPIHA